MAIETVTFNITGITPLLMHSPYGMYAKAAGSGKASTKKASIPSPEEEAELAAYRADSGQLYMPSIAFRSSLIKGGRGLKFKGERVGAATVLSGAVFTLDEHAALYDPETGEAIDEYVIHAARVVVQRAAVIRHRPKIDQWGTSLRLEINTDFVPDVEAVLDIFQQAGQRVGVGDWRPEKSGMFGRYEVAL